MNSKNLIEIKNLEFYWNNQDEFKFQINDFSIQTNEKKLILGKSGIAVTQKVFGIILLAIAVKLFTANIKMIF